MLATRHPLALIVLSGCLILGRTSAAQPTTGSVRTAPDALSTLLEYQKIFRQDVQEPAVVWSAGANAFCIRFTVTNPYSGRPEPRYYGVRPNGDVGPGELICARARQRAASTNELIRLIQADLAARLRYPSNARASRTEGTARVVFTVHRDGLVSGVTVSQSSGSPDLDAEARSLVTTLTVPAFPPDEVREEITFLLPINFAIDAEPSQSPTRVPSTHQGRTGTPTTR